MPKTLSTFLLGGLCCAAALVASVPAAVAEDAPVPLTDFFRTAVFEEIKISPGGTKVAALSTYKEHLNLYVIDIATKKPVQLTGFDNQDVRNVRWVGENRLLFTTVDDGYGSGGLFAIDADGKNSCALGKSVRQQGAAGSNVFRDTDFLSFYGDSTEEILVVSNERRLEEPDVYVMKVRNGGKRIVAKNPGRVQEWLADGTGAVRLGKGGIGADWFLVYRDGERGEFREILRSDFRKGELTPLAFTEDNRKIYVSTDLDRDTAAIRLLDPATGKLEEPLFADPVYDASMVLTDRRTKKLLGYVIEREKVEVEWVDPELRRLYRSLKAEFPDRELDFTSRSLDGRFAVLDVSSDRDPGTFYFFDAQNMTLEKLVERSPWIDPAKMSAMTPVEYTARDGLVVRGYLTLPAGKEPKNLPLIVNPHGGPWARDSWGFNPEVQLLASRGYAVFQINFRGSIGYGRKFKEAGYGQWGLKMQDDITDGVKWAIAQGIADPARVGIYGASYGGYAAMAGAAFTPDLYRCAVNYVGVTDIALLLKTIPKTWSRERVETMTGTLKEDRERLEQTSVVRNADRIRIPIFFAYGEVDDRIDMRHATKLATQLRHNGVKVTWMTRADEGHGYRHWDNKIAFYTELERFLAANMGPLQPDFGQIGESKVIEMPVTLPAK